MGFMDGRHRVTSIGFARSLFTLTKIGLVSTAPRSRSPLQDVLAAVSAPRTFHFHPAIFLRTYALEEPILSE